MILGKRLLAIYAGMKSQLANQMGYTTTPVGVLVVAALK